MPAAILYIDDDAGNLTVLEAVCAEEFEVVTADNGPRGLEILKTREIGVLISDQRMPGMTGVEVLEAARAASPETVRVLITAYSDLGEAIASINRGAVERYLRKPWQPDELRAALRESMATYNARRKMRAMERRLVETERVYALGVVAASVAHELRSPLTVLLASIELAQMHQERLLDETKAGDPRIADCIRHSVELLGEAAHAAEQLVDITRGMELGQRQRASKRIDLREIVTLTSRILRSELIKKAQLDTTSDLDLPMVNGEPHKLGQVVLNLMVNAIQALPAGRSTTNRVRVALRRAGSQVALEVEDNGPGIAPEALPHIFDPFFTTKEDGGTGLGLAISRQIIEEMGGSIEVESSSERGSRFTVLLPAAG